MLGFRRMPSARAGFPVACNCEDEATMPNGVRDVLAGFDGLPEMACGIRELRLCGCTIACPASDACV
jgi:hypothetical protein